MNGVDIISQTPIVETKSWVPSLFGTVLFISIMFVIFVVNHLINKPQKKVVPIISLVLGIAFIIAMFCSMPLLNHETGRYKYTAYISEDVSMVEFNKQYTNIEYSDGIWSFEDRAP